MVETHNTRKMTTSNSTLQILIIKKWPKITKKKDTESWYSLNYTYLWLQHYGHIVYVIDNDSLSLTTSAINTKINQNLQKLKFKNLMYWSLYDLAIYILLNRLFFFIKENLSSHLIFILNFEQKNDCNRK